MKSLKKTLVLLVVFSMILSAVMPAFAATDIYGLDCEEEVARLEALKVVSGYEDGTYGPEKTITRAEMAVILCKMVGIDTVTVEENKYVPSKFSDVAAGEWYTGHINVAAGKGLLSGFPDGTFRPSEQLTMNQVLTLCVNALGRGEYVAEMGTWPANYIAEATKLGLLDGVKTSDANRGNVAIIVWNTLEAPYVWDVTTTEYEGSINLGNSTRSLLSIYFRDYVFARTSADDEIVGYPLKEVEYMTVSQTPATNGELGEKQIQLIPEDPYARGFAAAFDEVAPRRTDDTEWTTIDTDTNTITAYAPAFDNLDSYFGKIVTVIFGKDNEVVSIRVVDETIEDEYLTAYDASSSVSNFTIGGTKYKFADGARVYANTIEQTSDSVDADEALVALFADLGITPVDNEIEDYTKVIKANVSLNNKGKVTRLDLFVSGTYAIPNLKTVEGVVTKIKNNKITLQYTVGADVKELTYDMSDIDEEDLPRIIKDGAIVTAKDIEVGNVLTYYYGDNTQDIKTVYISDAIVTGEVTKAKKEDKRIYTDEGDYVPSMGTIFVTEDKLTEADDVANANSLVGETVELYLNIYGEYVLAVVEDVNDGNWEFGYIKTIKEFEQVEDSDDYEAVVRMLLPDGSTSSKAYKLYADEDDLATAETFLGLNVGGTVKTGFVAFTTSGDIIDWDDIIFIGSTVADNSTADDLTDDTVTVTKVDGTSNATVTEFNKEYEVIALKGGNAVNDSRKRIYDNVDAAAVGAKNYKFLSDSVIYNVASSVLEVSAKWNTLISGTTTKKLNAHTLVIVEKDETDIVYAIIDVSSIPTSDAMYALVADDHTKVKEDEKYRYYLKLMDETSAEAQTVYAENDTASENEVIAVAIDSFVEYILADDEIDTIRELVKVVKFAELESDDAITADLFVDGAQTHLAVTLKTTAVNTVHGTYTCPKASASGADHVTTCDSCTLTKVYAAEQAAVHGTIVCGAKLADGAHKDGCTLGTANLDADNACQGKATCPQNSVTTTEGTCTGGCTLVKEHKAEQLAVHGTTCPNTEDTDLVECDLCTVTTAHVGVTTKANFKVVYTEDDLIKYEDSDNEIEAGTEFGEFEIDEDVVIYDLRADEDENIQIKTMTFKDLADEVAAEEYVYVIPFYNNDKANDADANVLVIVD